MPTRRPAETTPDLFSALPTVTAAGPSAVPKGKAGPNSPASQQRHFLPEDLAGALKRLDDVEIDALLAAVTTEAERRGRRPPSPAKEKPVADAKPQRRQEAAEDGAGSLTTGKLNAVRAAFKAGVKPSAIARQFGISQSDVRKALAQGSVEKPDLVMAQSRRPEVGALLSDPRKRPFEIIHVPHLVRLKRHGQHTSRIIRFFPGHRIGWVGRIP